MDPLQIRLDRIEEALVGRPKVRVLLFGERKVMGVIGGRQIESVGDRKGVKMQEFVIVCFDWQREDEPNHGSDLTQRSFLRTVRDTKR